MSQLLIQKYLNDLDVLRRVSGTNRESVVRRAFERLLEEWGKSQDLVLIPEWEHRTAMDERRLIDGALVEPQMRLPHGYWEAKDLEDDLDKEIAKKLRRGYPQDNIIFENSKTAVLWQNKREIFRCAVDDPEQIARLVEQFFKFEPEIIREFRKAVEQFKEDLPAVLATLRAAIEKAEANNPKFKQAAIKFLKHAQETINPSVNAADVREMLIQHILTEEIFSQVFDNSDFHHNNNVAKELYALEATFFTGGVKRETIDKLKPYYAAIRSAAALVSSHQEKQRFLKVIYENFYKVYNRKAADRLGVAYTPNEIVRFMIESADWLCHKHFGKRLIDRNVEILDPATGTGTFIVDLLEHFRGQREKLRHKYLEELHANEVAILPYYVANLNIEATYADIMKEYLEYPNLCFVDTLDNLGWSRAKDTKGAVGDLFGAVSDENIARIKRQNERKISVIIGNPPYNANQLNANQLNKNRKYPAIDKRIKQTYISASSAQKTKQYDMFVRFVRWATDRLPDEGVLAFVTNRSFIDKRNFDGFRKTIAKEFSDIYIVDLGGDWKKSGVGGGGNVFGIGTGVAISFMVKSQQKSGSQRCTITYGTPPHSSSADKLKWLASERLAIIPMKEIEPDAKGFWFDLPTEDVSELLPIGAKSAKLAKIESQVRSIFKLFSLGVATNRDDWVYDDTKVILTKKVKWFIELYESERARWVREGRPKDIENWVDRRIKWTSELEDALRKQTKLTFDKARIRIGAYRPFTNQYTYYDHVITHRPYQQNAIYPIEKDVANTTIVLTHFTSQKPWMVCAVSRLPDLHYVGAGAGTTCFPRARFSGNSKIDNISNWALTQFQEHYGEAQKSKREITKDAIFHYVYGVLHDPVYREKYALNLKREFPRIPFYVDFWKWADWGEKLMNLHIGYETVEPWPLKRIDTINKTAKKSGIAPKPMLKALREVGSIQLDSDTQLTGIPKEAWDYRLGSRSALEWILDQYKEKTPKDPTIRELFNIYRFADYKDHVIDLLKRVTRVSVETMAIINEIKTMKNVR